MTQSQTPEPISNAGKIDEADDTQAAQPSCPTPSGHSLWLERTGKGSFVGRNERGLEVKIGHADDEFTPGELFKLAIAGCNATSSDSRFASALGDDYDSTVGISTCYDKENDRFTHADVEFVVDLGDLDEDARSQLERRAMGAIDRKCTIGHTVSEPMTLKVIITSES